MVQGPLVIAGTVPELNGVRGILAEERLEAFRYSDSMPLLWVVGCIE